MSARRVSLSDLADRQTPIDEVPVSGIAANEPQSPRTAEENAPIHPTTAGTEIPQAPTPLRPDQPKRMRSAQRSISDPSHMRYDEYERKETRLRDDQYGRLTTASRRLNKHRKGRGERITENTLIRVAIDLLLDREGQLQGISESELRKSVGL